MISLLTTDTLIFVPSLSLPRKRPQGRSRPVTWQRRRGEPATSQPSASPCPTPAPWLSPPSWEPWWSRWKGRSNPASRTRADMIRLILPRQHYDASVTSLKHSSSLWKHICSRWTETWELGAGKTENLSKNWLYASESDVKYTQDLVNGQKQEEIKTLLWSFKFD